MLTYLLCPNEIGRQVIDQMILELLHINIIVSVKQHSYKNQTGY